MFHQQLFQLLPLLDSSRNAGGQDWSFTVFSQIGWICFKAWFTKLEKCDGKLAIASEDFDIHESCFTNPSRQIHKACHNLPLPTLSLYSLNILPFVLLAFLKILDLLIIHRSVFKERFVGWLLAFLCWNWSIHFSEAFVESVFSTSRECWKKEEHLLMRPVSPSSLLSESAWTRIHKRIDPEHMRKWWCWDCSDAAYRSVSSAILHIS